MRVIGYSFDDMWFFAMTRLMNWVSERSCDNDQASAIPPLHVRFNLQEVFEAYSPWLPRCSFEHEASKLRMKLWEWFRPGTDHGPSVPYKEDRIDMCAHDLSSFASSSSLASESRISAWQSDRRTFFWSSSTATTRYSTWHG